MTNCMKKIARIIGAQHTIVAETAANERSPRVAVRKKRQGESFSLFDAP